MGAAILRLSLMPGGTAVTCLLVHRVWRKPSKPTWPVCLPVHVMHSCWADNPVVSTTHGAAADPQVHSLPFSQPEGRHTVQLDLTGAG